MGLRRTDVQYDLRPEGGTAPVLPSAPRVARFTTSKRATHPGSRMRRRDGQARTRVRFRTSLLRPFL